MIYLQQYTHAVNHMQKKMNNKNNTPPELNNHKRETKILNVICNTTILLMSVMTETFTSIFTKLSKEMITAITTGLDAPADTIKKIHGETNNMQNELPKQIREQLLAMKIDVITQMKEKKEKFTSLIADRKFDEGIKIVGRYNFSLPKLSSDLDEQPPITIANKKEKRGVITNIHQSSNSYHVTALNVVTMKSYI
jgi:hypothetical protein